MKKIFSFLAAALFAGSMMAAEVLSVDFTQGQGDWTINNVTLPEGSEFVWAQTSNYGMKATAYFDNINHESESWLISPAFSLEGAESATLVFSHARKFGELEQLSVVAKSANDAEWTELVVSAWPDGSNWNFIEANADLADFVGNPSVQVAFLYTSSSTAAATWEIKTVSVITDGAGPVDDADVTFLPADFEGQGQAATLDTPGGEVSTTKGGVTVATNNGYGHNLALRVYKGGHFSISSVDHTIRLIKFQFYETYNGGLENEINLDNTNEWEVAEMASQARIEKIQIYFSWPEAIENVELTEKAQKVMVDGVLYIVRDGKMFDVRGAQVR